MREARADVEASKVAAKATERERKKRKEAAGAFAVEKALKRRSSPDLDMSICKKDGEHDEESVENISKRIKKSEARRHLYESR